MRANGESASWQVVSTPSIQRQVDGGHIGIINDGLSDGEFGTFITGAVQEEGWHAPPARRAVARRLSEGQKLVTTKYKMLCAILRARNRIAKSTLRWLRNHCPGGGAGARVVPGGEAISPGHRPKG